MLQDSVCGEAQPGGGVAKRSRVTASGYTQPMPVKTVGFYAEVPKIPVLPLLHQWAGLSYPVDPHLER